MNIQEGSVFISYKREISWIFAHFLKERLERLGFDVFLDVDNLKSGRYEAATLDAIATRTHFIIILEPGSLNGCRDSSCWMAREIRCAIESRRNVIPVTVEGFRIDRDISQSDSPDSVVELRGYNALIFSNIDVDGSLRRLVEQFLSGRNKNNREEGFVASYSDCVSWGWDEARMEDEILELARATMPGMHTSAAIRKGELGAILSEHHDTWRILATQDHYLLGYWHVVPLFEDQFEKAWKGLLMEEDISASALPSIEVPGAYDIYIAGLSLRRSHRTVSSFPKLLSSFAAVARSLATEDAYLNRVCATAITAAGESLCKTLGMNLLGRHCEHGFVYGAAFADLVRKSTFLKSQGLNTYYSER